MTTGALPKVTIGVWIEEDYKPEEGGGYTFNRALVESIDRHEFTNVNFVFLTTSAEQRGLSKPVIRLSINSGSVGQGAKKARRTNLGKLASILKVAVPRPLLSLCKKAWAGSVPVEAASWQECVEDRLSALIESHTIDIVYFPVWWRVLEHLNLERSSVPYVTSIWDLGHVTTYAFPEFSHGTEWSRRESAVRRVFGKALLVFCESESGKKQASTYLGLHSDRFAVVPFFVPRLPAKNADLSRDAEILSRFELAPSAYFFYPAQFWPHKNHFGLLMAFRDVVKAGQGVRLVLVGSDKGNLEYVKNVARSDLDGNFVVFAGFVDDMTIAALYRNAIALVMPTFLGPTNLPLLEAMEHACPVICSDFDGHREMLGDAAIYVDPTDHKALARAMVAILHAGERQQAMEGVVARKGCHRFIVEEAMLALDDAAARLQAVRGCWK